MRCVWTVVGVARAGVALALALEFTRAEAQVAKLNGPLARPSVGDVVDYAVAPEDGYVVLRAYLGSPIVYELFVAPLDGSVPAVRLHDPLPPGANIGGSSIRFFGADGQQDFEIVPGGQRVLFVADLATDGVDELYSVPVDRSASPLRLNGPLAANEDVGSYWITADGEFVVYRVQQASGGTLFRVPVDGSAPPTPLAPGLLTGSRTWLSPDGSQVVFTTSLDFGQRQELWVVPADGSTAPLSLGETPPPLFFGVTGVTNVLISEDNEHLVCFVIYDEDGDSGGLVFAARLDGTAPPPRLSLGLVSGFDELAFDGERALFREGWSLISARVDGQQRRVLTPPGWNALTIPLLAADGSAIFPAQSGSVRTLLKAPIDGSAPAVELFPPVAAAVYLLDIVGTHALYSVVSGSTWELRAVPLTGGSSVLLNLPPFGGSSAGLAAHPSGADVLLLSEGGIPGMTRLFTVPIDGSAAPRLLSGPLVASGDVRDFRVGAGGAGVAYRADANNNESFELFGVPHAGGAAVRLSPPLAPGPVLGDVKEFGVTADGERVLYLADQAEDEAVGLYLARSDARGTPRRLDAGLPETNDVFPGFATSANGRHVAYLRADSSGSASGDLFAVDLATGGTPRLLDTDSARFEQELVLDAQATRVFYRRLRSFPSGYDLVAARLDGSLPPDVLNLSTGTVDAFRITPDGATAVFRSTQDTSGVFELFRVPTDGSAVPRKLSGTPVAEGDVTLFELAPDGARVVFLHDRDSDNVIELYSAPSDASAPALELNPPLVAGGDVTHFLVTADSAFVVYRADQSDDQTFELYRVPIGGGAAVALTAALPVDRAVQSDFVLAHDGQAVFFRANPAGNSRHELFRVPADGSAVAVALSGAMVAGGSVDSFALTPDGTRLAFIADGRVDNVKELWSVPTTGGSPLLLHTMPTNGDVDTLRIAPDSQLVFHRADALVDAVQELFVVPLDGSAPPRRLNAALPSGADVEDDFVALTAGRVVFRADQEEANVLELFLAFPGTRGALQAPTPTRTVVR